MTAANVTNNHSSTLGVGSVSIRPGATALVPNWDRVKNGNAVKIWLNAKIISADEISDAKAAKMTLPGLPGLPGTEGGDQVTAEDQEKDALIAELKSLTGEEKTRKSSLESLRKQVEEAKAKAGGQ